MKRVLSLVLTLCMVLSLVPMLAVPMQVEAEPVENRVALLSSNTVRTYSKAADGNTYLSKNFKVSEFACSDGSDTILIDSELVTIIQNIRDHFATSVSINSAYRTPSWNEKVGGVKNSYHTMGMAADIHVSGVAPSEVAKYAETIGVRGVGLYSTFVHVDSRQYKYYWQGSGSVTVSTHGGTFNAYPYENGNVTVPPPAQTHSYTTAYESKHPHLEYRTCSCGDEEYTGKKKMLSTCEECYPVGNVVLTRSVEMTKGRVTFHRENIANANQYTLEVHKDGGVYGTYTMSQKDYVMNGLPSGTYIAVLYAKNTNTGKSNKDYCESFRIYDTYKVSYNANGGSNAPSSQTKIEDTTLTLTTAKPYREGHIFKGWASSKNALEPQYQPGGSYTKNAKITLYAVWEPEIYTVTYDVNGGIGSVASEQVTYGNSIEMPNSIIKDYAYLMGWSTSPNATKVEYALGQKHKIKKNLTLYAVWGEATWGGEVSASLSGQGTEESPYLISTAADLAYLANKVNTQTEAPAYEYYQLTDNINMAYAEWLPIGVYSNTNQYFHGSFDGNGYTISDFYITKANQGYVGLFGYTQDSVIKDLTMTGAMESLGATGQIYAGGLAGYGSGTTFDGITMKYFNVGSISVGASSTSYVGVMVGYGSKITRCKVYDSTLSIKDGKAYAGMIGGNVTNISDCQVESTQSGLFSTSATAGAVTLGGLCGYMPQSGIAERCSVKAPYFSNNINATGSVVAGGLIGSLYGKVKVCSVQFLDEGKQSITANASSELRVGGIAGFFGEDSKITDCKFDGKTISATTTTQSAAQAGGLVGRMSADSASGADVTGGEIVSRLRLSTIDGYAPQWYTDAAYTIPYDYTKTVTGDMTLYAGPVDAEKNIWDGSSKEPSYQAETKTYTITCGEELAWVSDVTRGVITEGVNFPEDITFSGYTLEIANDIHLNDTSDYGSWGTKPPANQWTPIGHKYDGFRGTIKGNDFIIYGIYINTTDDEVGLIRTLQGTGKISHLMVDRSYISGDSDCGGIVGIMEDGVMEYCSNGGIVKGDSTVGGIVGNTYDDTSISYCYNDGSIAGKGCVGGIVGSNGATLKYCYNSGTISGIDTGIEWNLNEEMGGIAGSNSGAISYCGNSASVSGQNSVGGIAGENWKNSGIGTIKYCYNTGRVKGTKYDVGGIVGHSYGDISYCYNKGSLSTCDDVENVGGIAGILEASVMSYCFNEGTVDGYDYVGGLIGEITTSNYSDRIANPEVKYSYNRASVYVRGDGNDYRGGIAGYAGGQYTGTVYLTRCYQNSNSLPYINRNEKNSPGVSTSAAYISSSNMKTLSNFTGFSTSTWATDSSINDGYPYLKSLKDSYTSYNVDCILDPSPAIDRAFVNISGEVIATAGGAGYASGLIGYGYGGTDYHADVRNVVTIVEGIQSSSTGSGTAYAGNVIAYNGDNSFSFDNAYYDLNMKVTSSTNTLDTTGIARGKMTMNSAFYTTALGLTPYKSLDYLDTDNKAVWVIKAGELPELYYNCLCDITISEEIEHGTIAVDKNKEIIGNEVTVIATPDEGYVLNKIYVNGTEIEGEKFKVNGESEVYAIFSEEIAKYDVSLVTDENASASLVNADNPQVYLMGGNDKGTMVANDGEEILVSATANNEYTVDSIFVNGEEIAGTSFILEEDTEVKLQVTSIRTKVDATTNDATEVGPYDAVVSGSVSGDGEGISRYIRYWASDEPDLVYTTEVQDGAGDYTAEIHGLQLGKTYYYQMTEHGAVKSFATRADIEGFGEGDQGGSGTNPEPDVPVSVPVQGITLDQETLLMKEGDEVTLVATITPFDATNQGISWSTTDSSVATVSNGVVTAVGVGEATITATTNDGGKIATCQVEVTWPSVTDTTVSVGAAEYNFSIACEQAVTEEFLCVGIYNAKGVLLDMVIVETNGDRMYTATLLKNPNAKYAKIFLWDTLEGMSPYAGAEKVAITQ